MKKKVKNVPEVISAKDVQIVQKTPMEMATDFLNANGDLTSLKEMMVLQREHDAYQAKKAYTKAMAEAKKNPPKIFKTKQVGFASKKPNKGPTNYKHADLGDVTGKINEWLANVCISSSFIPDQSQTGIKITCTLTHELGHSESVSLFAGADTTGNKNGIQAIGSTISYLERYTILALTGLATHDQDDDGNKFESVKFISETQVSELTDLINEKIKVASDYLEHLDIKSIEELPEQRFNATKSELLAVTV